MPKRAKELSAIEVRRLTLAGLHFVGEVPGLALQVLPTGGRTWVLRTMVGTRRRDMGLGGYPEVGLADARAKARAAREAIRAGIDPIAQTQAARSALRATALAAMTFRKAATSFIDAQRPGWRNPKHAQQWEATLEQYAHPLIGDMNVADIALPHVLQVLEQQVPVDKKGKGDKTGKLWEVRTETASRLRGRIESVLDWCKGRGHRAGDNPAAWKGCLDAQLPRPEKVAKVEHFAAVPLDEMGNVMADLRQRDGISARAVEFAILCAARSGEVRGATWSEIDLEAAVWTVPAKRMKAGREHRVPLSGAAIAVLQSLPRFEGVDYVFAAPRGGQLSDMSMTAVMRRMGRGETVHGFRSTFRDWCGERTAYPRDLAEHALAHTISNAAEAAYRRQDALERRRPMMAAWADFCASVSTKATVVGIGEKRRELAL